MSAQAPKVRPTTPEWFAFTEALTALADAGRSTPCTGPLAELWTSEYPDARAVAAQDCRDCPLLDLCHAAAESTREGFGTWAGRDRTKTRHTTPEELTA